MSFTSGQFGNTPLALLSNKTPDLQNLDNTADESFENFTRVDDYGSLGSKVEVHRLSLTHFSEVRPAELQEIKLLLTYDFQDLPFHPETLKKHPLKLIERPLETQTVFQKGALTMALSGAH